MGIGGVRFRWWHVTYDLASVERDPVERGMRELVDVVPAQLLREKPTHARQSTKLWKLTRVPKGVWKPKCLAAFSKVALKESLAVKELPDKRLSTRHVRIVFDPATADRLEDPLLHLFFN